MADPKTKYVEFESLRVQDFISKSNEHDTCLRVDPKQRKDVTAKQNKAKHMQVEVHVCIRVRAL